VSKKDLQFFCVWISNILSSRSSQLYLETDSTVNRPKYQKILLKDGTYDKK